ncbi:YozE family protein [Lacticaseibacillus kribbianus]|uniref:YozE family protein n=1 Tax=Lacticaseibacillus kribbianus TaxID=2926292 RepID=UPI001CD2CCF2|nr:YozE family protein [Lacticaseibacillus kribbianus]
MRQSFYQFLMTLRNPNDHGEIANFAQNAFLDQAFPKQEDDFEALSNYLELNGNYLPSMSVFDDTYAMYQAHEHVGGKHGQN